MEKVIDYLQNEVREAKSIVKLDNGEFETIAKEVNIFDNWTGKKVKGDGCWSRANKEWRSIFRKRY